MIEKYFHLEELGTSVKQELIGGFTTFITMSYIIIVNPKILEAAGIPFGPSMVATILTAFVGTFALGIYANRPFAIAPYMGENAFIAFTVVKVLGYSWQTALGAIFISGAIFTLITLLKIRTWLANSIPESLKISFAVGIGLFLTFIGLNDTGIVTLGVAGAPVHVGNFGDVKVILAIVSFLIIVVLMIKKINGSIIVGIISVTLLGIILKVVEMPKSVFSLPPDMSEIFLKLDIKGALTWGFFAVILTVLVTDFVDTLGTLLGVGYKAGLMDKDGNLPEIEKPMLCDALSTVVGSLFGTTTAGIYIESAAGIEAGARSGLSAIFTSLLFLLALFFAPFFTIIPSFAYGSALIVVGILMISPISKLDFTNLSDAVPSFVTIILMSFTYNIAIGMTVGFIILPLTYLISGRKNEISSGLLILFLLSILFYAFFPY